MIAFPAAVKVIWSRSCGMTAWACRFIRSAWRRASPSSRWAGPARRCRSRRRRWVIFWRALTGAIHAGRNVLQRLGKLRLQACFHWRTMRLSGRHQPCQIPLPDSRDHACRCRVPCSCCGKRAGTDPCSCLLLGSDDPGDRGAGSGGNRGCPDRDPCTCRSPPAWRRHDSAARGAGWCQESPPLDLCARRSA